MRNYLFACVESEERLALLVHGCDVQMGCLHADQRNRDSLALDTMERCARTWMRFSWTSWKIASLPRETLASFRTAFAGSPRR
jgi:hypothetical protein